MYSLIFAVEWRWTQRTELYRKLEDDWNQATTAQLKFYQEFRKETVPVAGSRHHVRSNKKNKIKPERSRILHFMIRNHHFFSLINPCLSNKQWLWCNLFLFSLEEEDSGSFFHQSYWANHGTQSILDSRESEAVSLCELELIIGSRPPCP